MGTRGVCVAALVGMAFFLAACGAKQDAAKQAVAAARKTLALPEVSYNVTFAGDRLFGPSLTLLGGRAASDLSSGLGYEALKLQGKDGHTQTLFLDLMPKVAYLSPDPAPAGVLPQGKLWITVPFDQGDAAEQRLAAQLEGVAAELPLAEVAWGAKDVSRVGTRVVQHLPATEYRVTVDLAKALAAAKRSGRTGLAAATASELRAARGKPVVVTMWVNGPGYVSQLEHAAPGTGLGTATVSITGFTGRLRPNPPLDSQSVPVASVVPPGRSLWDVATGS